MFPELLFRAESPENAHRKRFRIACGVHVDRAVSEVRCFLPRNAKLFHDVQHFRWIRFSRKSLPITDDLPKHTRRKQRRNDAFCRTLMFIRADSQWNTAPTKLLQHLHNTVIGNGLMQEVFSIAFFVLCHKTMDKCCVLRLMRRQNPLNQFLCSISDKISILLRCIRRKMIC